MTEGPASSNPALVLAKIIMAVEQCFPHPLCERYVNGSAINSLFEEALCAQDRRAFTRACQRFLCGLQNGHTGFSDERLPIARIGFHARPLDGRWTVVKSRRRDILVGDVVRSLGDTLMDTIFEELSPYVSASRAKNAQASLLFHTDLLPHDAGLWKLEGKNSAPFEDEGPSPAPPNAELVMGTGDIAILRLPDCAAPTIERATALLDETPPYRALTLDLIGYGGGNTPVSLICRLVRGRWQLWTDVSMLRDGLALAQGDTTRTMIQRPSPDFDGCKDAFDGPLAILTDPLTASAAEDLILALTHGERTGPTIVVGETTAGTTGQPFFENLGNGMTFRVAAKRCLFPSGDRFEGIGFEPHIVVAPTPEGLASGKDEVLTAGLEILSQKPI